MKVVLTMAKAVIATSNDL